MGPFIGRHTKIVIMTIYIRASVRMPPPRSNLNSHTRLNSLIVRSISAMKMYSSETIRSRHQAESAVTDTRGAWGILS